MSSSYGNNGDKNNNEKFGFNLLRKKPQQPSNRSERRADDSSSSEDEAGPSSNYVSSSQLNLPSFRPSGGSTDELNRANRTNVGSSDARYSPRTASNTESGNRRQQMIEDDAIATIRDNSGAARCFDDDEEEEEHQEQKDSGKTPADISPRTSGVTKKLQFKSHPSIIPEDTATQDGGEYYEEKDAEKEDQDDSVSTQSSESKMDHFRHLFRRRSTARPHQETNDGRNSAESHSKGGMRNLNGADDEVEDGGFLSKFLSLTGGGLTPAVNNTDPSGENDHERNAGQNNLEDPIPMSDIAATAQQIVQAHSMMAGKSAPGTQHGASGSASSEHPNGEPNLGTEAGVTSPFEPVSPFNQSTDGETMVSSHQDDAFYVPATNHYDDIDDPDDLEPLGIEGSYIAPVDRVRGGVLGSLLKLYQNQDDQYTKSQLSLNDSSIEQTPEPVDQAGKSDQKTGKKIYNPFHKHNKSQTNVSGANKSGSSMNLPNFKATRPKAAAKNLVKAKNFKKKAAAEARITVHIADLLQRQRFILRLCKALMLYGAPTHRLEEYMVMTSRVLEIDGQFLYVPGCMIISFGDMTTRTSEVQLVRCNQGLNLWKLHGVHSVYKQVVHDIMSVEDANMEIDRILTGKNLYPPWVSVLLYAFCSSMVTPFAFGGDWINMAVAFGIGLCVGSLQFIVSQKSNLYSNVFEVTASIVVSFCGRALGSIPNSNICFGATVQGSLALILPGYIILCGSLELQSRNLVAGAVRMFYAIIYSLFLGFGITLGAALFGWIYHDATNETSCSKNVSPWFRFIFVPCFSIGLGLINQARWTQLPVMTLISCCGYVVTYFSGKHFANSTEFTSAMAAFVIGILGNLYSRIWKGFAVSAMLPAIFVQVPSGVASQSSLLAGVQSANAIVNNGTTTVVQDDLSGSMSFGVTMIQVSIGISVGLFASTLFIYPFGKKRTGLFTL